MGVIRPKRRKMAEIKEGKGEKGETGKEKGFDSRC